MLYNKFWGQVQFQVFNMEYMIWDDELEKFVVVWVSQCIWEYGFISLLVFIGQNLVVYWGRYCFFGFYVQFWYDEVKDYIYFYLSECNFWCLERCLGVMCMYYIQIVWVIINKVGCVVNICWRMIVWGEVWENVVYFVCNYFLKGNWIGEVFYKNGWFCFECLFSYGGGCRNNLCY